MDGPSLVSEERTMKINVKRIRVGGETLQGSEPPAIMDLDEPDVRFLHEISV